MRQMFDKIRRVMSRIFARSLDYVEIIGNRLPHPATLFALLALLVVLISWLGHVLGAHAVHPVEGSVIEARNLLSADGLRWMYTNLIENFLKFPPLGYVLVVMIGIGVAEGSGLFNTMIRSLVLSAPPKLITGAIVLAGILSHLASEAGYVILIPLGAMIFHALGRHPMAGLAAAFCGVSGGFGANFFIGSIDPVLAGISESAAQMIIPDIRVNPAVNYYFMFVSGFLVVIVGTWVTEKIVEPRLGKYQGNAEKLPIEQLTPEEKKGLKYAGWSLLLTLVALAFTVIPENGVFRDPATGSVLHSPFFDGIIIAILIMFFIPGLVYGIIVGTIKSDKDVAKFLGKSMAGMGGYIVLVFFAATARTWIVSSHFLIFSYRFSLFPFFILGSALPLLIRSTGLIFTVIQPSFLLGFANLIRILDGNMALHQGRNYFPVDFIHHILEQVKTFKFINQ